MKLFSIAFLSVVISVIAQFSLKRGMAVEHTNSKLNNIYSFEGLYSAFTNSYILLGFFMYAF